MPDDHGAVDVYHSRLNVSSILRQLRGAVKTADGRTETRCAVVPVAGRPIRNSVRSGIWAIVKGNRKVRVGK